MKNYKTLILLLGFLSFSLTAEGQCPSQSFDWGTDDFGTSVAMEDTVAVVGARLHDFPFTDAGRAHIYRKVDDVWALEQELIAFDASPAAAFGSAVAISPTVVVVGAPGDDAAGVDAGSVYIFRYDGVTWEPEVKITAADASAGARFGAAVAIDQQTVVVGAPQAGGTGQVYVYRYDGLTWIEEGTWIASDAAAGDEFGFEVSVSAGRSVIGAPGHDSAGLQAGKAYLFLETGGVWSEETMLTAPDASPFDRFGTGVSINGNDVMIGSPGDDLPTIPEIGAAYFFRNSGGNWASEQKLVPPTPTFTGWFGYSVSIKLDVTVVGSPTAAINGEGRLSTFVREEGLWTARPETPQAGLAGQRDGFSVATSRGWAISGAPVNGQAHFLEVDGPDCDGDGVPDRCQIAIGQVADCDLDGIPDPCGLAFFSASSGDLLDVDGLVEQQYVIPSPPFAGLVTFDFLAKGDLASPNEAIDVSLNGVLIGRVFEIGANDCPTELDSDTFTISGPLFDTLVAGGDAIIGLTPTAEVDAALCPGSVVQVSVSYQEVTALDCDASGVVDGCEILAGTLADCDGDAIPDACEVATFADASPELGPLEGNGSLVHVIPLPPAGSDVTLDFTANGDLGALTESVQVRLNGSIVGTVFSNDGADCNTEVTTTLVIPGVVYNFLTSGTDATFTLVPSATVNGSECPGSSIRFTTQYQRLMPDDCDGNGTPDDCDLASGTLEDLNGNGVPDACEGSNPSDCNGNGVPDEDDLTNGTSSDCDLNGVPDECDIGNGSQQDCDGDGAIDSCEIADGSELDCDGNGIPDACNVNAQDCNNNGIFDSCEIEAGTVADCDENGVPDECLVAPVLRSEILTGPMGYQFPVVVGLTDLPPAVSQVTIRLEVTSDLGESTESAEVTLAGSLLGTFFQDNGSNCPSTADLQEISLDPAEFNALLVDGAATLEVVFSTSVDPVLCDNPGLTWTFTYEGEFGIDLDGNGIPDGCEQPFQIDCDNDGIPNDVEIANGTATDCNNNEIPDDCEIDNGSAPDTDGDGVIDSCQGAFIRGDVDGASAINIADAVALLDHLFNGGGFPPCEDAADANDDGALNIGDPVKILQYLFSGGDAPVAPWPDCGVDPTAGDTLDCLNPPVCP